MEFPIHITTTLTMWSQFPYLTPLGDIHPVPILIPPSTMVLHPYEMAFLFTDPYLLNQLMQANIIFDLRW